MNCQTCQFEIEELGISERLGDEARAHLSVCHMCRAFHDERQALKKLVGGLGTVSAPPDFDFRLRARLAAAKEAGNHRSSWRSFVASAPALALAASFALLVAGFVFYNQMRAGSDVSSQPGEIARQTSGPEKTNTTEPRAGTSDVKPEVTSKTNGTDSTMTVGSENRRTAKRDLRRRSRPTNVNVEPRLSNDFARRPAPVITPDGGAIANAQMNPVVELPIRSASQPMRVFVGDISGAKRRVTIEPVIFGSQDLTGRNASHIATAQGIW